MGNDIPIEGEIKAPALATNALITPPDGIVWTDSISPSAMAILDKLLLENNIKYANPSVIATTGDFNADGKMETVVFSNPRINSLGYLDINVENKTLFSLILLINDDGSYQTLCFSFCFFCRNSNWRCFLQDLGARHQLINLLTIWPTGLFAVY